MPISHCQPCVMTPEATWSWFPLWLSIMIIHLYSYFFIGKLTFSTMINHGHPVSCLVTELSNVALGFAAGAWTKHHWKAKKGVEAGQSCKINIDKTYHTIIPSYHIHVLHVYENMIIDGCQWMTLFSGPCSPAMRRSKALRRLAFSCRVEDSDIFPKFSANLSSPQIWCVKSSKPHFHSCSPSLHG